MSTADRFYATFVALALAIGAVFGLATRRLLVAHVGILTNSAPFTHWCFQRVGRMPDADEIVLLGLLAVGIASLHRTVDTVLRQRHATRALLNRPGRRRCHSPRRLRRADRRLGLSRRVTVVRAVQPIAFCHGLVRPRICLSTGLLRLLDDDELEALLLHERFHLRHYDPLRRALARVLGSALFFVPVIDELARHCAITQELSADRAVIAAQGHGRFLGSALYKLVAAPSGSLDPLATVASGRDAAGMRIDHLLSPTARLAFECSLGALFASVVAALVPTLVLALPGLVAMGSHVDVIVRVVTCTH